jgi:branched-chain amino acid transport system permease protein
VAASRTLRLALVAVLLAAWALLPLVASRSVVDLLVFTALYSIAGLGVSFLLGQCGIVSLAQSVFYGIGAYASAYLCVQHQWPIPLAILTGAVVSMAIAAALGWSILRLSGFFLALATLALAVIGHTLFVEWNWLTGGTLGTGGVPRLDFFGLSLNTPQRFYYFIWPVVLLVFALHYLLLRSRFGLAMRGMRDAPNAALALGIPIHRLKVQVFVLSAALGSVAGSLFAHYVSFVSTDSFGVDKSIHFLLIAVLGGVQTVAGTILGSLFVTIVPSVMSRFGDIHALLFAILLVVSVMFMPHGFGGAIRRWWDARRRAARREEVKAPVPPLGKVHP